MDDAELRERLEQVHSHCFGWALACCGRDREQAEEILQTAYLKVLDGRARFDGRSSFRTWMFGIIRHTAAAERRKSALRSLLLARKADHVAPSPPEGPDAAALRAEGVELLGAALAALSDRQRSVLQLVFYHEMTVEDAALALGISTGSARTHYARGKERLAKLLHRTRGAT